jgi:hypothetical protein
VTCFCTMVICMVVEFCASLVVERPVSWPVLRQVCVELAFLRCRLPRRCPRGGARHRCGATPAALVLVAWRTDDARRRGQEDEVRCLHTQLPQLYEMTESETETQTDPPLEQRHKVCFFVISYD